MSEQNTNLEVLDDEQKAVKKMLTNRKDDYEYSREVLYQAAERLQDVLDSAVDLAKESEHPRAIEVATGAANALGDIAAKMMDHHLKTEKLNNPDGQKREVTNNTMNVKLNTKDLLELLGNDK